MRHAYLDHSATTPIREEVLAAMMPYFSLEFGNASSIHTPGRTARKAVELARKTFASILGTKPREIIFTSGGTEADNLAVRGIAYGRMERGKHIITSSIEHAAVLNCCRALEREGFEVTYLPVDEQGRVSPADVLEAMQNDTILVTIMIANNEVGTIQPIEAIAEYTTKKGIPFHTDAVQAAGKMPLHVERLNVDALSLSGHKIHGPKGVGVLYLKEGLSLTPLFSGGRHEFGYRPGTENVASIVGMAKAMKLANEEQNAFVNEMKSLQSSLAEGIKEKIDHVLFNGEPETGLPNIVNVSFRDVDGDALVMALDTKGIFVSTGSACSSGSSEPSHVLKAMGRDSRWAGGSIRFSLGRLNKEEDIDYVLSVLPEAVESLRQVSPGFDQGSHVAC